MYAGALFTAGEFPFGGLYINTFDVKKYYPIVKNASIDYIKPACTGVTIEVSLSETEILKILKEAEMKGRSEFTIEGELLDVHGECVAKTRNVYQIRKYESAL